MGGKTENNKKNRWILYIFATCVVFLSSIYFIVKYNDLISLYNDKAYPGQYIGDINITGYNEEQIELLLNQILEEYENKKIVIKVKDEEFTKNISEFDIEIKNKEEIISKSVQYGKNGNFFNKVMIFLKNEILNDYVGVEYKIDFYHDELGVETYVDSIVESVDRVKVEPRIEMVEYGEFKVINGEDGFALNKEKLITEIKESLKLNSKDDKVITANGKIDSQQVSEDFIKKVDTKISTFTTTYSTGSGRATNVEIGSSRVNKTFLMPNEIFSLNETVLQRTRENGYKTAPEYRNGKVVEGIGGGICQVSTTVYGAMLRAGIIATERYPHSMTVSYAPIGLDAAISGNTADLKFINTYEYPIYINSYTSGGKLTVEFWSNSDATKGITYSPKSYAKSNLKADAYLYGYDSAGKQVSKKYLGQSTYRPKAE